MSVVVRRLYSKIAGLFSKSRAAKVQNVPFEDDDGQEEVEAVRQVLSSSTMKDSAHSSLPTDAPTETEREASLEPVPEVVFRDDWEDHFTDGLPPPIDTR